MASRPQATVPAEPQATVPAEPEERRASATPAGANASGADLVRALAVLCEPPGGDNGLLAAALGLDRPPEAAEITDLFVLQLPPYAGVYLGPEGMLGGEAADRVAGFWRALGQVPPAEPDHLATLLGLYAVLVEAEAAEGDPGRQEAARRARSSLAWEHLLPWAPAYLTKAGEIGARPCRAWAYLLLDVLQTEGATLGIPLLAPLHLRAAPPPADPGEGGQAFLSALLAPVRSGMILTRADLSRAGAELDLGVRMGERRYILGSLFDQEPGAVLAWLAAEAARWAEWAAGMGPVLGPVARWWEERARATRTVLVRAC